MFAFDRDREWRALNAHLRERTCLNSDDVTVSAGESTQTSTEPTEFKASIVHITTARNMHLLSPQAWMGSGLEHLSEHVVAEIQQTATSPKRTSRDHFLCC